MPTPNFPPDGVLHTSHGPVQGEWFPLQKMARFTGIPYADPPVGPLRFRKPKAIARPWDDVKRCTGSEIKKIALQAPQARYTPDNDTGGARYEYTEDCLYLNLWMPDTSLDYGRRPHSMPVVVLVHGGGLISGSCHDAEVDGSEYAGRGVIAVAPNYRLGPLGVLKLGTNGDYNCAMWDVMAALEFVNKQVHFFGGDANNVTLCGVGAGSDLTMALLASSHAYALRYFQKVILQNCALPVPVTIPQAQELAAEFTAALGIEGDNAADWHVLDSSTIVRAQTQGWFKLTHTVPGRRCADLSTQLYRAPEGYQLTDAGLGVLCNARCGVQCVYPVRDGDLLKDSPLVGVSNGVGRGVPVLVGCDTNTPPFRAAKTRDAMVQQLAWELAVVPGRLDQREGGGLFATRGSSSVNMPTGERRGVGGPTDEEAAAAARAAARDAIAAAERVVDFYSARAAATFEKYGADLARGLVWEWITSDLLHAVPQRLVCDGLALQQTSEKHTPVHAYQFLNDVGVDRTGLRHPPHTALTCGTADAIPTRIKPLRNAWHDVWTAFISAAEPRLPWAAFTHPGDDVTRCEWDAGTRAPVFRTGRAVREEEVAFVIETLKGLWQGVYLYESG